MKMQVIAMVDKAIAHIAKMDKQARYATAVALTRTAQAAKKAMPAAMSRDLDRPTPFTQRGIYTKSADKATLTATIGIMDKQAEYMRYQIIGGTLRPGARGLRLPSAIGLNQFGNIPKGIIKQLVQVAQREAKMSNVKARRIKVSNKVEIYYGDPSDVAGNKYPRGIYKRIDHGNGKGSLIPLIVFPVVTATYQPKFDFHQATEDVVRKEFDGLFAKAFDDAMRSAR